MSDPPQPQPSSESETEQAPEEPTSVPVTTSEEISSSTSFAESHPDANTPGFVLEVPDESAKKFIFRSRSKTKPGEYDVITVIVPEVVILYKI